MNNKCKFCKKRVIFLDDSGYMKYLMVYIIFPV